MEISMQVPVFIGDGKIATIQRPVPHPQSADEVMIKVKACGICGTDLNILAVPPAHKARPGIIIGHEATGTVLECGEKVKHLKPGDRVAVAPRIPCGKCRYCRRGLVNQCEDYLSVGTSIDGAFAPYLRVPASTLYLIPDNVADDDALLFEPLSCAVGACERAPIRPGNHVAIIGAGPMGLIFAMLYRALGAGMIFIIDIAPQRLEQALKFDVDVSINPAETSVKDVILGKTGIGCDIVVDAVGNQLATALEITRRYGHILLFGLRPHDTMPIKQYAITRSDLTVSGTFVGLNPFVQTMQLLESGIIMPGRLISHRLPLESLQEGIALMRSGKANKVAIVM